MREKGEHAFWHKADTVLCFEDAPDSVPGGKDSPRFGETARLQSLPGAIWT